MPAVRPDRPRRVYKQTSVARCEAGYAVELDGRAARTPSGGTLILPTSALAGLVEAEWRAQETHVDFSAMPVTRLAFGALDRAPAARKALAEEVRGYAASDLVCFRAEGPERLVRRQSAVWDPLLAWSEERFGIALRPVFGLFGPPQPDAALGRVFDLAAKEDDFALTALAAAAALFSSAVIALALRWGRVSGVAALDISRLDEIYQEEAWGVDAEAARRAEGLAREAGALDALFKSLGSPQAG